MELSEMISKFLNRKVLTLILVLSLIFLISGGVYVVVERPPAAIPVSGGAASFIWMGLSAQTTTEFFAAFLLIALGTIGAYLLIAEERRESGGPSTMRFALAFALVILSFVILEYLVRIKLGL